MPVHWFWDASTHRSTRCLLRPGTASAHGVRTETEGSQTRIRGRRRLDFKLQAAGQQGIEMPMIAAWKRMFNITLSPVMVAKAVLPTALQPLVMWLAAALGEKNLMSHEARAHGSHHEVHWFTLYISDGRRS